MSKFVFKLQALLNIKEQMEDSLKNELGKAIQELEKNKEILKEIQKEKDKCLNELSLKARGKFVPKELKEYIVYISYLKHKIKLQKENVKSAQENVDKVREELLAVMQEREVLEKLKEKKYKHFMEEELRKENKLIDEIVSFKYSTNGDIP
ncbi:MAG: flagellar export protein FliJ [Acetivibrionales bacterium]|jgi:flagellar FliJ protein